MAFVKKKQKIFVYVTNKRVRSLRVIDSEVSFLVGEG